VADDVGGGISSVGSPTIVDCTISDNLGGGVFIGGGSPTLTDCTISGNMAREDCDGGGILVWGGSPLLTNCTFVGNSADDYGGGVFCEGFAFPQLNGCLFAGNTANDKGGGVAMGTHSDSTLVNCTFSGNSAEGWGGGIAGVTGDATLTSCVLWNNVAPQGAQIALFYSDAWHFSDLSATYSDVQGGFDGAYVQEGCTLDLGPGSIDADPLFVDPDGPDEDPDTWQDNDYRLGPGSPCIDAGDPDYVPPPGETDLDGHARLLCEYVDIGAYEFGIGDYNCDGVVDLTDFAAWGTCMTGPDSEPYGEGCQAFDFEFDADVDLADFAAFQALFGT